MIYTIKHLDNRTQRAILNGQYSSWAKVEAGVSQGSILGSLLFLIYIGLKKIAEWAFQWKMNFNTDPTKQ